MKILFSRPRGDRYATHAIGFLMQGVRKCGDSVTLSKIPTRKDQLLKGIHDCDAVVMWGLRRKWCAKPAIDAGKDI